MPRIVSQITAMAATAIQAPSANLDTTTMTSTTAVTQAPIVLIVRDLIIRSRTLASVTPRRLRFQCRIIPVWLHTNDTKTPTMYSWMSRVGDALNATMSTTAKPDSSRMPLL